MLLAWVLLRLGGQASWGTHLLTAMGSVLVGREWLLPGEALPGVWPLHRGKGTGSKLMPDRVE